MFHRQFGGPSAWLFAELALGPFFALWLMPGYAAIAFNMQNPCLLLALFFFDDLHAAPFGIKPLGLLFYILAG